MELTLLDRYVLYSEMLIHHEIGNELSNLPYCPSGLCGSLSRSLSRERFHKYFDRPELRELPEIWKRKPKHITKAFWFKPFNHSPRIKILKAAIREVVRKMNYDLDNY